MICGSAVYGIPSDVDNELLTAKTNQKLKNEIIGFKRYVDFGNAV